MTGVQTCALPIFMDKKSTIGLILIGIILAVWVYVSGPTKEQIAQKKRYNDSVAAKIKQEEEELKLKAMAQQLQSKIAKADNLPKDTTSTLIKAARNDSIRKSDWQDFYPATIGTEEMLFIENEKIKAYISTKSGRITNVVLKEFLMPDKKTPVELFKKDSSNQSVYLNCYSNKLIPLDSLFFIPDKKSVSVTTNGTGTLKLKMPLLRTGSYIEYVYTLKSNDYMVGYNMNFVQMDSIITPGSKVEMLVNMLYPSQEKHIEKEKQIATIYYCNKKGSTDNLSQTSSDSTTITDIEMKWIALKQQFFSTVLINDDLFDTGTKLKVSTFENEKNPQPELQARFVKSAELKVEIGRAHV